MKPDYQNNLFIFIERLWLVGAIFAVGCCIYFLIQKDNDSALFFFGFFILASLLYILRKGQRKKQEAYLKNKENKK
ncbi:MAG: hypothetical protein H0W61_17445 [Bacteroidetes bacterium]|nr:hypothetical protein [Bacteroidota bacterium]